ncbi:MAG: hypothetical protein IKP06_05580 [Elusimicrobiaceae bacterium]|nr:hypothetical protein [Elusimicrobiaceae bacterium]
MHKHELLKPYTDKQRADFIVEYNHRQGLIIKEDEIGLYTEEPPIIEPTLEEQVIALERKYEMNRWQREGILAEGSLFSDYTKAKAQEIETLAEELRHNDVETDQNTI